MNTTRPIPRQLCPAARGAHCHCILPAGHNGPHVCTYDDDTSVEWESA